MSFIGKLFGKSDTDDTAGSAGDANSGAPDPATVDAQSPAAEPTLNEAGAQTETGGEQVLAIASDESPWWAVPASDATPTPAKPEAEQASPRTTGATQPLDEAVVDKEEKAAATPRKNDRTRPLSAPDAPPAQTDDHAHSGIAFGALRDVGQVRSVNQDSLYALVTTLPRETGDMTLGLFVVADGMGGHEGGEVASRMAIGVVAAHVLNALILPAVTDGTAEAIQPVLVEAVQAANRAIWEHSRSIGSDMGTTCTVAVVLGRALYIGHVGDSRAYLATTRGMDLLTDDHSTVGRLIKLGQLDLAESREHPLRSQLYRTVGQTADTLVDFVYQPIGDATHLLMGSDGLWSMLDDSTMHAIVERHIWPQNACVELVAKANEAGGEDNISAIVVALPASKSG